MTFKLEIQNNKFRVITQVFSTQWLPDTSKNKKVTIVMLRSLVDNNGKPLFTFQELSVLVESNNRQAASWHIEDFRDCGEDFWDFLKHRQKVEGELIEAVREIVLKEPLMRSTNLSLQVNQMLGREDISIQNVEAALKQIGCDEIRKTLRKQLESGKAHYKESYLLEEMMRTLSSEAGGKAKLKPPLQENEVVVSDPTAIRKLITPGIAPEDLPESLRLVGLIMTLYYHNVPLSVLGRWFKVSKTTVLRWMIDLALALWPIIWEWLKDKVEAKKVYVDEKWVKIKEKWHYWFVVLDEETELPVLAELLPSRRKSSIRWIGCKLKLLKKEPEKVITDGLAGYPAMIPDAQHVLCRFHHQQSVTRFLKQNFPEEEHIKERKTLMKKVFQTKDKRTVRRRLSKLQEQAESLGIMGWIINTLKKLPSLICSIGSSRIPSTSNAIERFFRSFNRFYKTRCGFHSVKSAKKQLILFMVVYLFTQRESGQAPIEKIMPEVKEMPLYKIINDPFGSIWSVKNVKETSNMANFCLSKRKEA